MSYFILMGRRIPKQAITGFKFQNETDNIRPFLSIRIRGKEEIDGAYDLVYLTKSKPWEELSEKDHYMRWAYIEDLLPCEEERG